MFPRAHALRIAKHITSPSPPLPRYPALGSLTFPSTPRPSSIPRPSSYTNTIRLPRTIHTTPRASFPDTMQPEKEKKTDWSATQYLRYSNQRTRPVYDLLSQVTPHISTSSPRIFDLGCGPANSTQALAGAFPGAKITGMDSSPDMLAKARATLPDVEFVQGDVGTFVPEKDADLLFSNAMFHWLRSSARVSTLAKLLEGMKSGGVLAIQVPDNYHVDTHRLMRDVALVPDKAWSESFAAAKIGHIDIADRPDLDPIEPPSSFYAALSPYAVEVNIWRTEYIHPLGSARDIVEWVKGTGLRPFLDRIVDQNAQGAYLEAYEEAIAEKYPKVGEGEGKVLLGYPRLFVVALRK
ncbi:S-adenosyl-L-methionine-dependent methyltransferase [Lentithecium fluviatile CBS 122367]|uniref:S-adenosyl-L-methionine-dependent methyltransferase n=1 Tax=Lentithecium fluviatile CBS 122367 TaxID=1168545 RepID=A0A6G1IVQ0_9PLEO|nr:S-adenosyl-L-methionine-dependent methyltransferase [Lentithecium fluviatile CBS 122367]